MGRCVTPVSDQWVAELKPSAVRCLLPKPHNALEEKLGVVGQLSKDSWRRRAGIKGSSVG